MAITVEFDGRYRNKISNVVPNDIVLSGKFLFVKGTRIPAMDDRLYDLFYFLEKEAQYKYGKVSVALLANGDIKYYNSTTNDPVDYYSTKILGVGTIRIYFFLPRSSRGIPSHDVSLTGKDRQDY